MTKTPQEKNGRLNDPLCVEDLEICVPKDCELVKADESKAEGGCKTHDCRDGWELRGTEAIKHAERVHEKIYRQALGLQNVNAIDVGFVILEREVKFENFLAIRIHVNQKRPPEQLVRAGIHNMRDLRFVGSIFNLLGSEGSAKPDPRIRHFFCGPGKDPVYCPTIKDKLLAQLKEELEDLYSNREAKKAMFRKFPIGGVSPKDLSLFGCFDQENATLDSDGVVNVDGKRVTLDDVRIAICGVPIDIVNAQYSASITHPGGDANSGIFTAPLQNSVELPLEERLLIGRGRVNPMVGGISIGSVTGQAGTLGTIVWDCTDGTPCLLSNWHVLAGTPTARVGQPSYQPALFDGGTESDAVAHLKRWHLGEKGDAALAELLGNRHYAAGDILGLWDSVSDTLEPKLNMEVRKLGRTTGFTEGFVDGIKLAVNIDYGGGVVRAFTNQFHISPLYQGEHFSQAGDSGSLVVTRLKPLNLLDDITQLAKWLQEACKDECREKICSALEGLKLDPPSGIVEQIRRKLPTSANRVRPVDPEAVLEGIAEKLSKVATSKTFSGADLLEALRDSVESFSQSQEDEEVHNAARANYAVGMIFAGDTPGSPFGEFAVASDIEVLADELRFSLRPVFEPRSSFRELRVRPNQQLPTARGLRSGRALTPGDQGADPRGEGPQPTPQSGQGGSGSSGGDGSS